MIKQTSYIFVSLTSSLCSVKLSAQGHSTFYVSYQLKVKVKFTLEQTMRAHRPV